MQTESQSLVKQGTFVFQGHKDLEASGYLVSHLDELLPYYSGNIYTGHTMRKKAYSFLLILRARSTDGPVVAFEEAATLDQVYQNLAWRLERGLLKWRPDKYGK